MVCTDQATSHSTGTYIRPCWVNSLRLSDAYVRHLINHHWLSQVMGLSPGRHQAIICTNAGILLIRTLGTSFSEILNEIQAFSFKKMHLKMSSVKWQFCLGLCILNEPLSRYALHWFCCVCWIWVLLLLHDGACRPAARTTTTPAPCHCLNQCCHIVN